MFEGVKLCLRCAHLGRFCGHGYFQEVQIQEAPCRRQAVGISTFSAAVAIAFQLVSTLISDLAFYRRFSYFLFLVDQHYVPLPLY